MIKLKGHLSLRIPALATNIRKYQLQQIILNANQYISLILLGFN